MADRGHCGCFESPQRLKTQEHLGSVGVTPVAHQAMHIGGKEPTELQESGRSDGLKFPDRNRPDRPGDRDDQKAIDEKEPDIASSEAMAAAAATIGARRGRHETRDQRHATCRRSILLELFRSIIGI